MMYIELFYVLKIFKQIATSIFGTSILEVLAGERFNAVKISYVQITALSNESQREISYMERNIGRAQTTGVANAIKSAPVLC